MNQIDVSHTIIAKSDQLNAVDLPSSDALLKIVDVRVTKDDPQPVHLHLEDHEGRPYKPCLSMRRVLIAAWGQYAEKWIGETMSVYCDMSVKWGGKEVGGIRISKLTGITKSVSVPIALNRSMREIYTVDPLVLSIDPDWLSISKGYIEVLNNCKTRECFDIAKKSMATNWNSIPEQFAAQITQAAEAKKLELAG